jgi:hypothetical protein
MTYTPKEKAGQYTPRSRVLIIDTSSNKIEVQKISFAFGFIDGLEPTSFCEHNNKLYFGSYLDANIYEFNPE